MPASHAGAHGRVQPIRLRHGRPDGGGVVGHTIALRAEVADIDAAWSRRRRGYDRCGDNRTSHRKHNSDHVRPPDYLNDMFMPNSATVSVTEWPSHDTCAGRTRTPEVSNVQAEASKPVIESAVNSV